VARALERVSLSYDPASYQLLEITDSGLVATDRVNAKLPGNNRFVVQLR